MQLKIPYLALIYFLDCNAISIGPIDRNVRIAELAVTQQFPDRIPLVEIFIVPKICSFAAGNHPTWPLGRILEILLRWWLLLLLTLAALSRFLMVVVGALLLLGPSSRSSSSGGGGGGAAGLLGGVDRGGGGGGWRGVAIGATNFYGWETVTHFSKDEKPPQIPTLSLSLSRKNRGILNIQKGR